MDPRLAGRLPLDSAWPLLKWIAGRIEHQPGFEDDWLARASARVVYYFSCAATREAFVSAARELALDPAFGSQGVWTRLGDLALPASFLWCGRDGLIPHGHAEQVAQRLPRAHRLEIPCAGHFVHGRHSRCFTDAVVRAVGRVERQAQRGPDRRASSIRRTPVDYRCVAEASASRAPERRTRAA
jgi:pimeloyl-ACP methyl ester carboxylesterase